MSTQLQIEIYHSEKKDYFIQTKPFELGIKITNIDKAPFKGGTISSIVLRSAQGQQIIEPIEKEFHVKTINPDQTEVLMFGRVGTYMSGLAYMEFTIVPEVSGQEVQTFQKNTFTKQVMPVAKNSWHDFIYIRSIDEHTRDRTNTYLYHITILMALVTVAQLYLTWQQTKYAEIQSIPEIVNQAIIKQNAKEFCAANPSAENSGLYYLDGSGTEAPCSYVLEQLK